MNYIYTSPISLVVVIISIIFSILSFINSSLLTGSLGGIFAYFIYNFYRGYKKSEIVNSDSFLVSPAEGTILGYYKDDDHPGYNNIAIYLSPYDRHVQLIPYDGIIEDIRYKPGEFNAAYVFEKSMFNERMETDILLKNNSRITVKQIAGMLIRRIEPFVKVKQQVKQGDELGIIKFGSRVDIMYPEQWIVKHKIGESVVLGEPLIYIKK